MLSRNAKKDYARVVFGRFVLRASAVATSCLVVLMTLVPTVAADSWHGCGGYIRIDPTNKDGTTACYIEILYPTATAFIASGGDAGFGWSFDFTGTITLHVIVKGPGGTGHYAGNCNVYFGTNLGCTVTVRTQYHCVTPTCSEPVTIFVNGLGSPAEASGVYAGNGYWSVCFKGPTGSSGSEVSNTNSVPFQAPCPEFSDAGIGDFTSIFDLVTFQASDDGEFQAQEQSAEGNQTAST